MNPGRARALVNDPVFDAVFDEYEGQCFVQWLAADDTETRERLHAKASVAREVKQQMKNAAVVIDGNDRAA